MDTADLPPTKRTRSSGVCTLCHARKVRCDLSVTGGPCTNCRLDRQTCMRRPRRRRTTYRFLEDVPQTPRDPAIAAPALPPGTPFPSGVRFAKTIIGDGEGNLLFEFPNTRVACNVPTSHLSPPSSIPRKPRLIIQRTAIDKSVPFSSYSFLESTAPARLSVSDVKYLESEGCFKIPHRSHLDNFVREYFLHVHPCMPVVDEADMWLSYEQEARRPKISLLLFQAMLFAASRFVPLPSLQASGFDGSHEASEALHHRASLLLQFKTETDHAVRTQAALLLSLQSTALDMYTNSSFLSMAIQSAQASRLQLYRTLPGLTLHERQRKKRLFWCVIVRDRTIALAMRRPLQVTPDAFDPYQDPLTEQDMESEMKGSSVYDMATKHNLMKTFVIHCQLAAALTSTVMITCSRNNTPIPALPSHEDLRGALVALDLCTHDLKMWLDKAEPELQFIASASANRSSFITVCVDLQWMYYHSAHMALSHFIIFMSSMSTHGPKPDGMTGVGMSMSNLMGSFAGLKDVLRRLVVSNQAGLLPISAVAYTAWPLLLASLDVQLSKSQSQKRTRMPELWVFEEAMRQYKQQFLVAQFLTDIIDRLLRVSKGELDETRKNPHDIAQPERQNQPQEWSELYWQSPHLYFKVLFSLDYAMSSGKLPSKEEYPDWSPAQLGPQPSPAQSPRLTPLATDHTSLCVYQCLEPAPFPVLPEQSAYEGWNLDIYNETDRFCQPLLSESVFGEESATAEKDNECTDMTSMSPSDLWEAAACTGSGSGSDNDQAITETLLYMLQYSCPAIG
ncbi:fungal-specific transcription factor domain-containing protein [Aspergillus pseudodeflectus]|uniref:Fungal-specific transcription factor domain-containing protein n=1 Tax=Aspergillus pseudodeflectus TaxID=176178 RepID=A0ABR4JKQ8_9EURO